MLTLPDLCERMKRLDEITLLEVLNISSEELIERFQDLIEERFDKDVDRFSNLETGQTATIDVIAPAAPTRLPQRST